MKRKSVKAVSMGLAALMAAGTLLTGCSSSGSGTETTAAQAEGSAAASGDGETAAASSEEVTITFPVWDLATTPYITDMVNGFMEANPNIKVNVVDVAASEYANKLSIMLNGGADCDVVFVKDPDTTASYAQKGQLEDLTPYIEADGLDTSKIVAYDDFNIDGKQTALPFKTSYYVLYYNKDIFDAAGVEYPTNDMTWTQWEEMCGKLTSGEGANKIYGGFLHTWQACVENWAVQDGKNTILGPDYSFMKPYYEMALRMQDAGTIMYYATLKTGNIAYASPFQQGTVATLPMGTWFMSQMIAKTEAGETDVNWGIATIPHPEGVPAGSTVGSTTPMGINAKSQHKDEAWEFIKYMCGPEGAAQLAAAGEIPAYQEEDTLAIVAGLEGMPEGTEEALKTVSVVPDRPVDVYSAEVNQMLSEEHSLIMIKEQPIDDVLAEMGERSKQIQGLE